MSRSARRHPGQPPPGTDVLAAAARAIAAVVQGRSAEQALAGFERHPRRAAIRAVVLGSLRWYLRLAPAIEALIERGRERLEPELHALLVAAAHQVEYSRTAPQASVHIAVDAARAIGEARASGLVNAVLRRFVAERSSLFARLDRDVAVAAAHPGWLVEALRAAWPDQVAEILRANDAHPPLVLRVDRTRLEPAAYVVELGAQGIEARTLEWAPAAVELGRPRPVAAIPRFGEGQVSVQDAGAQLAAPLLEAAGGMRILDACAAPGGKTLHLLEETPALRELVAIDIDAGRLERVRENLERAGRTATLLARDVRTADPTLGLFDRILVDAPCSSTGVIRRHPDIKLLRRPTDIASFVAAQLEILQATFRLLKPGGRLLYSTCSVLPAENEGLVLEFLGVEREVRPAPMPPAAALAPGALARRVGIQLLPGGAAGTDGFYYACLEKTTAGH